jgi:hypothetical protein
VDCVKTLILEGAKLYPGFHEELLKYHDRNNYDFTPKKMTDVVYGTKELRAPLYTRHVVNVVELLRQHGYEIPAYVFEETIMYDIRSRIREMDDNTLQIYRDLVSGYIDNHIKYSYSYVSLIEALGKLFEPSVIIKLKLDWFDLLEQEAIETHKQKIIWQEEMEAIKRKEKELTFTQQVKSEQNCRSSFCRWIRGGYTEISKDKTI